METIPNCTILQTKNRRKNLENMLHLGISYGILEQNRVGNMDVFAFFNY